MTENLFSILSERGFVAQSTDEEIARLLERPLIAYIGFDPTSDSFHVGSLMPLMALRWLQQAGHRPIALLGSGTALVGDPSGKTEMRKMLSPEQIENNGRGLTEQFRKVVQFGDPPNGAKLLNNGEWLARLNWIEMLREVGACFSVNRMLTMDSVKNRMETGGISFLEFNYMVMQAYDFLHLHRTEGCVLQLGGQDQWGNIVMGVELVRRLADGQAYGLTFPLLTKSDGTKFGKSEKGAVWLSAQYTPVYDFFQFWRNTADADVRKHLGFFTTLPMSEVRGLTEGGGERLNHAKEVLAFEVTRLVHGGDAAEVAREDARRAFGSTQDVTGDSIPHADIAASELEAGVGLLALLVRAGLAQSNGDARRLVQGGGVRLHDRSVEDPAARVTTADIENGYVLARVGKKRMFRFDVR